MAYIEVILLHLIHEYSPNCEAVAWLDLIYRLINENETLEEFVLFYRIYSLRLSLFLGVIMKAENLAQRTIKIYTRSKVKGGKRSEELILPN